MCYTAIIKKIKEKKRSDKNYYILLNLINDNYEDNENGYAIRFGNEVIRTLNLNKFIEQIKANKEKIIDSELIHLHLRNSTNIVSEKFIHLWSIRDYICGHNGILQNRGQNDSLTFFQSISKNLINDNLKSIKRKLELQDGWGVFLLTHKNEDKIIVASLNKSAKFYFIDKELLVISSDEIDFDEFKNSFEFIKNIDDGKKIFKFLDLDWTRLLKKKELIEIESQKLGEILFSEKENFIALIDKNKIVKELKLKIPEKYKSVTYYHYPASEPIREKKNSDFESELDDEVQHQKWKDDLD